MCTHFPYSDSNLVSNGWYVGGNDFMELIVRKCNLIFSWREKEKFVRRLNDRAHH